MKVVFLGLSVAVSVGVGMSTVSVAVEAGVFSIRGSGGVAEGEGAHAERVTRTQKQQYVIRGFI